MVNCHSDRTNQSDINRIREALIPQTLQIVEYEMANTSDVDPLSSKHQECCGESHSRNVYIKALDTRLDS